MYWWGKAESKDLIHYQQVTPFAMTGENSDIRYFTGSVVVDKTIRQVLVKELILLLIQYLKRIQKASTRYFI